MGEKLQYSGIAEKELFKPLVKELKAVEQGLENVAKGFEDIAKAKAKVAKEASIATFDDLKKKEEALESVSKAMEGLGEVEKERVKVQKQLQQAADEEVKGRIRLQKANKAQRDSLRDELILNSQLSGTIEKLNARSRQLRRERESLNLETEKGKERLIEINEQLDKNNKQIKENSDTLKKQKLNVGNYADALEETNKRLDDLSEKADKAGKAAQALGIVFVLVKAFESFSDALSANSDASDESEKALARWFITFNVIVGRLVSVIPAIQGIFGTALNNITAFFDRANIKFDIFLTNLEIAKERLNPFSDGTAQLESQLAKLEEQLESSEYESFSEDIDTIAEAFNGVGAEIDEQTAKQIVLIEKTSQYRKEIIQLEKSIAKLSKERERLLAISEDDTRSLEEQLEAAQKVADLNEKIGADEIAISNRRLELATLNAQINKNNIEAQEELAAAYVENQQVISEAETARVENSIRQRAILLDLFDENLDDLIDFADNSKTINERILNDDKETIAARERALNEALRNQELAFEAQIKLFTDIENERKRLIAEQDDEEFVPFAIDIDEILSIEDTVELNKRIKELDLTERQRIRLLELVREERTVQQDLKEAQNDLNEGRAETLELNKEIILQEAALLQLQGDQEESIKAIEELEANRLKVQKANLQARIDALSRNSVERLKLEKELNDLLIQEQQTANEKKLDEEKKQQEQEAELREKGVTILRDILQKRNEAQLEAIDNELSAEEKRIDRLQELANQGVQNADENLATAEKRQAELEAQKQRQIEQQAKQELALTAIEVYGQKVASGSPNPLASTITDIEVLRSFVRSLPAFYEGSERVGDDLNPLMSGRDGHIIRVDGDERILNPTQNAMIPKNMSNFELAMLAQGASRTETVSSRDLYLLNLGHKMDEVKGAIENKPSYLGMDYDPKKRSIIDHIQKKGKLERNHRKTGGIWGN
jgi:hypothetical protein